MRTAGTTVRWTGVFGALCITLAGCAHTPPESACTSFGNVEYCLQPSTTRFSVAQSVQRSHAQGVERLIVYFEVDDVDTKMVGLTPFGQRVFQIRFDGKRVSSDLPVDADLDAQHILAGLQLAFWPLEQARAGIRGSAAQLQQTPDGSARQLTSGDAIVFAATCQGERPICRTAELRYETLGQRLLIEALEGRAL
jgi:hypothetical protein